ncbi:hypothetical protein OKW21_005590 [Catalinimonas alkaloidigena]|nr:hypothetical protein [Catalinimonas alkaloidigena]
MVENLYQNERSPECLANVSGDMLSFKEGLLPDE